MSHRAHPLGAAGRSCGRAALAVVVGALVGLPAQAAAAAPAVLAATQERRLLTDDRKILVIVGGLVLVALALTLLTVRYWRLTRPVAGPAGYARREAAPPDPVPTPTPSMASPAGEPEPDAAIEPDPDPAPEPLPAATADGEPAPVAPEVPDDAAGPVPVVGLPGSGRPSRRAVAGADHAGADPGYEPRGTGQHDRVVVPRAAPNRPGRAARKAVLTGEAADGEGS